VEFQPDHARSIQHAFMFIDPTRDSRRRDELDAEPGFAGLHTPPSAQTPPGQFLSWQPGKLSTVRSEDFSWLLQKNCDLVLQMHLRPSGKAERVEPKIGFYFTDQPPKATPYKFGFVSFAVDVAAGEASYEVWV